MKISSRTVLATVLAAILALAGTSLPLAAQEPLAPAPAETVEDPAVVAGTWQGTLEVPGAELRLVVHIEADDDGALSATMDSPDQGAGGIPVRTVTFEQGRLVLDVASVGGGFQGELDGAGERIVGTWSQGGMEFPLELERGEEFARPPRPQEPEPPLPYREEEVRYPNPEAGIELAGTLTLPPGEGPFPAVALISGSGAQNRDGEVFGHRPFLVLADHLSREGIAVLRSDDRGVGESEGDFGDATSLDFAGDAAAAVAHLRDRPEIDPGTVGLAGLSEGGIIAPMVAAGEATAGGLISPDDVAFVVLLAAPGVPGEEILYRQSDLILRASAMPKEVVEANRWLQQSLFPVIRREEGFEARSRALEDVLRDFVDGTPEEERTALAIPPGAEDEWVESQLQRLAGPWFRYFLTHDPRPVLHRVDVPVLALWGELDLQVDPDQNLPAVEAALREGGNPDFTVEVLPGLNHLFQSAAAGVPAEYARIEETFSPEALERISAWILERTGTR